MNQSSAILFLLTTALIASACQGRREVSDTTSATDAVTATAPTTDTSTTTHSGTSYDLQFIDTMARHHEGALVMAGAAAEKATHAGIREAAARMITDQKREIAELDAWRDKWYPGAASAENMAMPGMSSMGMDMSHMETMRAGPEFDLMFLDMMIPHHQGAITMAQVALAKAEHEELKVFAQKVIDAQAKEIEQMKAWKTEVKQ